jgi:4-hydroxy-3-methylbut-2-enyl diphosphate reductase
MDIEVDDKSGFCFGVVEAISRAEAAAAHGPLVSLGDIVHNDAEMARLEALGLEVAGEDADMASLAGRTVLIRAHGEPPETYSKARRHGVTLIDATCPVVARLQKTVAGAHAAMSRVGGQVVIFGQRGHAEVRGLTGQIAGLRGGDSATPHTQTERLLTRKKEGHRDAETPRGDVTDVLVVECDADLGAIDFGRPIYFLAQTTGSLAEFRRLGDEIVRRSTDPAQVRIHDTICRQVSGREEHLARFARRFDVVVFVSGAKSSNGRVLFEAVRAANPSSHKIESAAGLRPEWFELPPACKANPGAEGQVDLSPGNREISVGVCGATSTPRWLMNEVAEWVLRLKKNNHAPYL